MSSRGSRVLVNEKSLELNITHELMSSLNVGAIGFTQRQESQLGADIYLPISRPLILQYKRASRGRDFVEATFRINNNKNHTQHPVLDILSRSGFCDVFYAFPLIVHNQHFVRSFGRLSDTSVFVPPLCVTDSVITKPSDWMQKVHTVTVYHNNEFRVRSSEEGRGQGISRSQLFEKIQFNLKKAEDERLEPLTEHIEKTIGRMERVLKEALILSRTEHTLTFFLKSKENGIIHYVSLPMQLRGAPKLDREVFNLNSEE